MQDLDALASLPKLKHLCIIDNPVTKQKGYRLYVISRCKKLKALDFRKVKQQEREAAEAAFGGEAAAQGAATFEPAEELEAVGGMKVVMEEAEEEEPSIRKGPTPEQLTAIKAAIAAASTLEEVRRLEEALKSGQMPSELAAADNHTSAMEEG